MMILHFIIKNNNNKIIWKIAKIEIKVFQVVNVLNVDPQFMNLKTVFIENDIY